MSTHPDTTAGPAQSFALNHIGQISINARDIIRATTFYRDVLGMKHLFSAGTMAFFECSGLRLMLSLPSSPEFDHPSSIIYFKVADIQAVHETLAIKGVNFRLKPTMIAKMPDHDLWLADFSDSEGNTLALMSEVRR